MKRKKFSFDQIDRVTKKMKKKDNRPRIDKSLIRSDECKIIIDTRESHSIPFIVDKLQKLGRNNIAFETHEIGDYHIVSPDGNYELIIELKKMFEGNNDFISSFTDGRLTNQLHELAEYDDSLLLIVTKNFYNPKLYKRFKYWKIPKTPVKFMTGVVLRRSSNDNRPGVVVIPDMESVITVLDYIAELIETDDLSMKPKLLTRIKKRKIDSNDPVYIRNVRVRHLEDIAKIGKALAIEVWKYFDWSYEKLFKARKMDFELIDGIGKTKAERIFNVYHL